MKAKMLLIPGRTSKQGVMINKGKLKKGYLDLTSTLEMNELDMDKLGIAKDDKVKLCTDVGEAVVRCVPRKNEDLPSGILFIPYGPASSRLMQSDTAGSGMPLSKQIEVTVEKCAAATD